MANPQKKSGWSWFRSFQYDEERDTPGDARNVLLVVVALITAVTFQAGVNPPGGVWQESENNCTAVTFQARVNPPGTAVTFQACVNPPGGVWQESRNNRTAGRAIYASQKTPFYVFLISNTLALSSAILVILSLTYRFPFHFEIWVAAISMLVTYGSSIFAITPHESYKCRYIMTAAAVPFLVRFAVEMYNKYGGKWVRNVCNH